MPPHRAFRHCECGRGEGILVGRAFIAAIEVL